MDRRSFGGRRGIVMAAVLGLTASVTTAIGLPAQADNPDVADEARPPAPVNWSTCPDDIVEEAAPHELTCATLRVPLDYSDPKGEQIELTISRLASENPGKRRGILLLNPGGPGSSGLSFPALLASNGLPQSVLDTYDLISMDTRGVGRSTPVSCGFTVDSPYYANVPVYAVDQAAVAERANEVKDVAEQCAGNDENGHLRHVSTANHARDLDRIRAALGEKKASFLGYSYGTALGATYDAMFPHRADRIVLDSNLGDTHLSRAGLRRYALGMEQTFPDFAKWAAERHDEYGLGRTPAQVRSTYFQLAERLDDEPVDDMDGGMFRMFTFGYLFNSRQYPLMAELWESVLASDEPAVRRQLSEQDPLASTPAEDSAPSATEAELSPADNTLTVFLATTCNDVRWPRSVQTYQASVAQDRVTYPLFGAAAANILPCAYWPYEPAEKPAKVSDKGRKNVLILQNQRDPVTPLRGAELAREQFGERSRLVTVDASGHGVYALGGDPCALETTTKFLLHGTLPRRDVSCRAR